MKFALILFLLPLLSHAKLMTHKDYQKLPIFIKVEVIKAQREFLRHQIALESDGPQFKFSGFFKIISEAYADSAYNCFYAGWPSKKVLQGGRSLCTSPIRTNSRYKDAEGSCQTNELACQPLLFGPGLCVSTQTRRQRNLAFNNCETKFNASGRSLEEVAQNLAEPENALAFDELFHLADTVCTVGSQKDTGMCRNLTAKISSLKGLRPETDRAPAEALEDTESLLISATENISNVEDLTRSLNEVVTCTSCQTQKTLSVDEQRPYIPIRPTQITPFPRIESGIPKSCGGSRSIDGYDELNIIDCRNPDGRDQRYPSGYGFHNGPGHPHLGNVTSPYETTSRPRRNIEFVSRNHAFNETYLYLADLAGGPDSHDVKSVMFIIPRKTIPSVEVIGNEVKVTLTTGEEVFFDKTSRAILRGALNEGPIDLNTDRFKRTPPNVHYNGSGISIRLDHRYEEPTMSTETAIVKQGPRTCRVPRSRLFDENGKLKTTTDSGLVSALNSSCPASGNQRPFSVE